MKTPLAIYNLLHQRTQTAISVSGVGFALLLVFMQLGFMGAVSSTATNVFEQLDFDILIRSPSYVQLYEAGTVDRDWEAVASGLEHVASADPIWISVQNWQAMRSANELDNPDWEPKYLPIAVLALEPTASDDLKTIWKLPELAELIQSGLLGNDSHILIDETTQRDYGPENGFQFGEQDRGRFPEIGGEQFEIKGSYRLGTGLAANGAVVMSQLGFQRVFPVDVRQQATLILVRLKAGLPAEREAWRQQVLESLQESARLPMPRRNSMIDYQATSAEILSRDAVLAAEVNRWLWQTPIGLIFQLGVVISLMVGAAIVYMILSTDVANRLPEYATLLAIGYTRSYLASIVMTQSLVLSCLGFLLAWGGAEILYEVTSNFSGIPLTMEFPRIAMVAILGALMCSFSGLLALRKLWKAEPANLF